MVACRMAGIKKWIEDKSEIPARIRRDGGRSNCSNMESRFQHVPARRRGWESQELLKGEEERWYEGILTD